MMMMYFMVQSRNSQGQLLDMLNGSSTLCFKTLGSYDSYDIASPIHNFY